MRRLIKLFSQYSSQLKYILLVVVILAMIMSIRTYLNFVAIEDAITDVEKQSAHIQEDIYFVEKFQIPYLSSAYADYFLAHENNLLFPGEAIIRFEEIKPQSVAEIVDPTLVTDIPTMTAQESWISFWSERILRVKN
jgi:hypothetical protein